MTELLERDSFLIELNTMLENALAGQGQIALISGEAGIGKTSLVDTFARMHQGTIRVLWGACDFLFTPRPLGPLHDIALQLKGELFDLLNSNVERQSIFSKCIIELQQDSTILVFEDIHWADEATLDLVKFLGRRIQRIPSLIILTYRDDELSASHPLRSVLGDLPPAITRRLQLSHLSETSVLALANEAEQTERAYELFAVTSGNPFFLTEILANKATGLPSTIRDAVLARATRLSSSARALLEVAAIIGLRIESWLLAEIAGEDFKSIGECTAGGMLQSQDNFYAFRHELARQTILETISPERKLALHRIALTALKESPLTCNDLARLANHAEGTRDASAVLEFAPAAARQASSTSAHREAIAFYELALQFADSLLPAKNAQILEAYSVELWFANRMVESADILKKAIELRHLAGDHLREGGNLALLADISFLLGRKIEVEQASQSAIEILETLSPSVELARAYRSQCFMRKENLDTAEAIFWGEKAIALAERFGDSETIARAYNYMGCVMLIQDAKHGHELMERSLAIGREANLPFAIAGTLTNISQMLVEIYQLTDAERYLAEGIAYATDHDDHYHLHNMLMWQALVHLYKGQWAEANDILTKNLQSRNIELLVHTYALLARGRIKIRQGEANTQDILDEALALSIQAETIGSMGPVRAARAEAAWLLGDNQRAIEEARAVYEIAVSKKHPWMTGELAFWRWRAGDNFDPPEWIGKPFALQISGDWYAAAQEWEQRGYPYEQALALMDGDEKAQLSALEIFERLNARPMVEKLKQKMRMMGIRGIPRGPRPATRENLFGLTSREMEVLACLIEGSSNPVIATKLSLSTRTVEHHITSILQKMDVQSRVEAASLAIKNNLLPSL